MVFMVVIYIEIINNTKGSIESKIGDHVVWGGGGSNSSTGCSLILRSKKAVLGGFFYF